MSALSKCLQRVLADLRHFFQAEGGEAGLLTSTLGTQCCRACKALYRNSRALVPTRHLCLFRFKRKGKTYHRLNQTVPTSRVRASGLQRRGHVEDRTRLTAMTPMEGIRKSRRKLEASPESLKQTKDMRGTEGTTTTPITTTKKVLT